jgi:hypothetical protein
MSNSRVRSSVQLPDLIISQQDSPVSSFKRIIDFLRSVLRALYLRDNEIASKVNQLHIEEVTAAPADASPPDDPYPVLRLYNAAGTVWLYVYASNGWHRVQLTKI